MTDQFVGHSTRLFPKNQGAEKYRLTGIASRCDWVIATDYKEPRQYIFRNERAPRKRQGPRHIFLSLRNPIHAVNYFAENVLSSLTVPFVLITGSEDATIPNQLDLRLPQFGTRERENIDRIANAPNMIRWFAENLDETWSDKVTPIPVGFVDPLPQLQPRATTLPAISKLSNRPLKVLCCHRVRRGPQWNQRRKVTQLANTSWATWCTLVEKDCSEREFLDLIEQHAFVLCVEGGGLDPSPKAWQALFHGAIPIVKSSAIDAAYDLLPVARVPEWSPETISQQQLELWASTLRWNFDSEVGRQMLLKKLSLDFWWDLIEAPLREVDS